MTCYPPGLPPCVNPRRRYPLQKICGQTNKQSYKQTVNGISLPCSGGFNGQPRAVADEAPTQWALGGTQSRSLV